MLLLPLATLLNSSIGDRCQFTITYVTIEQAQQVSGRHGTSLFPGYIHDDFAPIDDKCTISIMQRLGHRVRDHDDRKRLRHRDVLREFADELTNRGIERGGRLVEQQHMRLSSCSHQQAQGLALASRQETHFVVEAILKVEFQRPQTFHSFLTQVAADGKAEPTRRGAAMCDGEIFENRQVLTGADLWVLENSRNQLGARLNRPSGDVLVVYSDPAGVWLDGAGNDIEHR